MNLFQQTVIQNQLKQLDDSQLNQAWQTFSAFFHDTEKQANIIASKEEQYQEGFLRDLFVAVFGYTLNPDTGYNLTTEFKNQTGAKKADGAILKDGKAIAVIELKGTDTTDLNKVEEQAFGYKNNQPHCRYVITSNFRKLRFYIDNAVAFIEWDLFTLSQADFTVLYLILHKDGLLADLPNTLKTASISQEENITKQLYRDYADFKRALFADLTAQNPPIDALILFKKSQKLLDRLLFIFFAEDSGLLPANFARNIIIEWDKLKALKMNVPLYQRFTEYFSYLNSGYKDEHAEIFAYNGGLFRPDEVLDSVSVSDSVLEPHVKKLSDYDFASEVDVNILGHIFENSLSEIEEVTAQLAGQSIDKAQSKRKKDGVFYTPKYITKYIVENTVGKLCTDKKAELNIIDENFYNPKRKTAAAKAKQQQCADNLNAYRAWLLQLTICDPACGSGAFLNEALNFLIAEHRYLDELESKLYGDSLVFKEVENHILENNLFGVDINEESVEIAKLSLWLRTAKRKRKLNNLSANIKCGNSLIDDPKIAGDKAFDWVREFPQVFGVNPSPFTKGGGESCEHLQNKQTCSPPLQRGVRGDFGFDVIIGNPPYGAKFSNTEKQYFRNSYSEIHMRTPESFNYFIYKVNGLISPKGVWGIIIPSSFLHQHEFEKCRKYLLDNTYPNKILNLGDDIFSDVATPTCILTISKSPIDTFYFDFQKEKRAILPVLLSEEKNGAKVDNLGDTESYSFIVKKHRALLEKCYNNPKLKEVAEDVATGISPGLGSAFVKTQDEIDTFQLESTLLKKLIIGGEIHRYSLTPISTKKIIYATNETVIENYPKIYNELNKYKDKLDKRVETANGRIKWYVMLRPRRQKLFDNPKILIRQTADRIYANYDTESWYCLKSGIIIQLPKETSISYYYLLAILNSKLLDFIYQDLVGENGRIFPEVKPIQLFKLPVKIVDKSNTYGIELSNKLENETNQMLTLNADLQTLSAKFLRMLARQFDITTPNKKLQKWYELDDKSFFAELEKDRKKAYKAINNTIAGYKKLSLAEQAEWEDYFLSEKAKAEQLTTTISTTDKEIDQMVYALYGLTAEEIAIVEQAMP